MQPELSPHKPYRNKLYHNLCRISYMGCFEIQNRLSTLSRQLTKSNFIYLELKYIYNSNVTDG